MKTRLPRRIPIREAILPEGGPGHDLGAAGGRAGSAGGAGGEEGVGRTAAPFVRGRVVIWGRGRFAGGETTAVVARVGT